MNLLREWGSKLVSFGGKIGSGKILNNAYVAPIYSIRISQDPYRARQIALEYLSAGLGFALRQKSP
jgi:hypothetical protein